MIIPESRRIEPPRSNFDVPSRLACEYPVCTPAKFHQLMMAQYSLNSSRKFLQINVFDGDPAKERSFFESRGMNDGPDSVVMILQHKDNMAAENQDVTGLRGNVIFPDVIDVVKARQFFGCALQQLFRRTIGNG
jgi:hypothetical protein